MTAEFRVPVCQVHTFHSYVPAHKGAKVTIVIHVQITTQHAHISLMIARNLIYGFPKIRLALPIQM